MAHLEKLKKYRTILRSSVTKLINNIDMLYWEKERVREKTKRIDIDSFEGTFIKLKNKTCNLDEVDNKIRTLVEFKRMKQKWSRPMTMHKQNTFTNFHAEKTPNENKRNIFWMTIQLIMIFFPIMKIFETSQAEYTEILWGLHTIHKLLECF